MLVTRRVVSAQVQFKRHILQKPQKKGKYFDWLWKGIKGKGWNPDGPPYNHVVQIGDPILRRKAKRVDFNKIPQEEIDSAAKALADAINLYDGVGMAAPQIGLSWQMFAVQVTEDQIFGWPPEMMKLQGVEAVPLTVIVNPKMEIVDKHSVIEEDESCVSVNGLHMRVPRCKEVIVRGHTPKGEEMKPWRVKNFTARIIQHEMDHLNGVLCVDRMTSTQTLQFTYWKDVNRKYGKFRLSYGGRRSLMNMWYPKSLLKLK